MRILFIGTGEIGLPAFRWLLESGHEIMGAVTQPDKPAGRKQELLASPIKRAALARGLPVFQPRKIREPDPVAQIVALAPDVIVVMAYGQILPKAILDAPRLACLNLHASLLPRHRGAAPIQAAILSGDTESGITVMYMDEGLDTGDVLLSLAIPIESQETGGTLHDRLAEIAPAALEQALAALEAGNAPRAKQDSALATYSPKLERENGLIPWHLPAGEVDRHIRAMDPWPGAYTWLPEAGGAPKKLKIFGSLPDASVSGVAWRNRARFHGGLWSGRLARAGGATGGKTPHESGRFPARPAPPGRHAAFAEPMSGRTTRHRLLQAHVANLLACRLCPKMVPPPVSGGAVMSKVLLVGQAPGAHEPVLGRPFAWTAGKTLFGWFQKWTGVSEEMFRAQIYMAAVCRCFPGRNATGGDRVPNPQEIENCSQWMRQEMAILKPALVIPVGRLAIERFLPFKGMETVIGSAFDVELYGHAFEMIPLPHPSGASPWPRMEPGKTLLARAMVRIARHPAFQSSFPPQVKAPRQS